MFQRVHKQAGELVKVIRLNLRNQVSVLVAFTALTTGHCKNPKAKSLAQAWSRHACMTSQ